MVDGGGSLQVGLMGDKLAEIAVRNGWAGVVINGAIRDSVGIDGLEIGVKALATAARRSWVATQGQRRSTLTFGDIVVKPGYWVYADRDAILVSSAPLDLKRLAPAPAQA